MARGRKKEWTDVMVARFPAATFDRIEILLGEGEDRTEFVREAVAREIERRYRILKKSSTQKTTIDGRQVPVVDRFVEPKPFESKLPEGRSFAAGEWGWTDSRNKPSDDD